MEYSIRRDAGKKQSHVSIPRLIAAQISSQFQARDESWKADAGDNLSSFIGKEVLQEDVLEATLSIADVHRGYERRDEESKNKALVASQRSFEITRGVTRRRTTERGRSTAMWTYSMSSSPQPTAPASNHW